MGWVKIDSLIIFCYRIYKIKKPTSPKDSTDFQWFQYCYAVVYVIKHSNNGVSFLRKDIIDMVIKELNISEELLSDCLKGKSVSRIVDRIAWAVTYLNKFGYLEGSKENSIYNKYFITEKASNITSETDFANIIFSLCKEHNKNYRLYKKESLNNAKNKNDKIQLENSYEKEISIDEEEDIININNDDDCGNWQEQLIANLHELDPIEFERFCKELLQQMDFINPQNTQATRDDGVDIVAYAPINSLVKEKIVIQCKRYKQGNNIGDKDLRDLLGAISLAGCKKGVFITLSDFKTTVQKDKYENITLLNGEDLCALIVKYYSSIIKPVISYEFNNKFFTLFNKQK